MIRAGRSGVPEIELTLQTVAEAIGLPGRQRYSRHPEHGMRTNNTIERENPHG